MQLTELFYQRASELGQSPALTFFDNKKNVWQTKTWKQYAEEAKKIAYWLKSPQGGGVQKGDRVALISPNRYEWLVTDLAILSIGAISVPIYPTSTVQDMTYIIDHADVHVVFTDRIDRIRGILGRPFRKIVEFCCDSNQDDPAAENAADESYVSWGGILSTSNHQLEKPIEVSSEDVATIIYTSGTTGRPKGVVHTYQNFSWALRVDQEILLRNAEEKLDINIYGNQDRFFSFLPLSHVAERILIEVGSILCGGEVFFARSIDTIADDLAQCRPTVFMCVPRLWEKMYEKIHEEVQKRGKIGRRIFDIAVRAGSVRLEGDRIKSHIGNHPLVKISDVLVGNRLRARLGLDRCRILATGAAPIRPDVMGFFASLGLSIREVYGLTENFTFGTLNMPGDIAIGSCGVPFPFNKIRIADDGEIQFKAPWMFKGYYREPELTREVLSDDGWFATGDLGQIDAKGHLKIIGRKKELIKTSGGKFIAPVPIENRFKDLPYIKDVVVIGDHYKYCVALVALEEGIALTEQQIRHKLGEYMESVNAGLASFETIKRIGVMRESLTISNGFLTPTLKIRRAALQQKKADFIQSVYNEHEQIIFEQDAV
jgi:long-chain acyl-CoA synthetase